MLTSYEIKLAGMDIYIYYIGFGSFALSASFIRSKISCLRLLSR
jgi:hypothetical protein